jgi:hypothetical protein
MAVTVEIPGEVLKYVYDTSTNSLMDLDEIAITIKDGKVSCKHKNASSSGMMLFESLPFESLKDKDMVVTFFTKDLKAVMSLVKKDSIILEISDGSIVFKSGKITKNFPRPAKVDIPPKSPVFGTSVKLEMTSDNIKSLVKSFSDIKVGDIKVTAEKDLIQFMVSDEQRSTNVIFDAADVVNYDCAKDVESVFDKELFISIMNSIGKGELFTIEMGDGTPIKFIETNSLVGTMNTFVAPRISD